MSRAPSTFSPPCQPPPSRPLPTGSGRERLAIIWMVAALWAACVRASPSPAFPVSLHPTARLRCPAAFPHGYLFGDGGADERAKLFPGIWLNGVSRGDNIVVMDADAPGADDARCIAIGPHRDLNLSNWCCRDRS